MVRIKPGLGVCWFSGLELAFSWEERGAFWGAGILTGKEPRAVGLFKLGGDLLIQSKNSPPYCGGTNLYPVKFLSHSLPLSVTYPSFASWKIVTSSFLISNWNEPLLSENESWYSHPFKIIAAYSSVLFPIIPFVLLCSIQNWLIVPWAYYMPICWSTMIII